MIVNDLANVPKMHIQSTPDKSDTQGTGKNVRLIRDTEYHANTT